MADPNLNEKNIADFAAAWYNALDVHCPFDEIWTFLADDGLVMDFPDGKIQDKASFQAWFNRVINIFFDENHNIASLSAKVEGNQATVDVVVAWQASFWIPPAAKSKRTAMDATQKWIVRPSKKNRFGLEICFYNATVEPFKYAPGFARL